MRHGEENRKGSADRQSLSIHGDFPRDEDVISRGRTLSLAK
jgi:hypothetical protein